MHCIVSLILLTKCSVNGPESTKLKFAIFMHTQFFVSILRVGREIAAMSFVPCFGATKRDVKNDPKKVNWHNG